MSALTRPMRCSLHIPDKFSQSHSKISVARVPRSGPSRLRVRPNTSCTSGCTVHPQVCTSAEIIRQPQIAPRRVVCWHVGLSPWQLMSSVTIHRTPNAPVALTLRGTHSAIQCRRTFVALRCGASRPMHTLAMLMQLMNRCTASTTLNYWGAVSLQSCLDSAPHARLSRRPRANPSADPCMLLLYRTSTSVLLPLWRA